MFMQQTAEVFTSQPLHQWIYSQLRRHLTIPVFVSSKNTELLDDIDGQKAMNPAYRAKALKAWQKYANDEAFRNPNALSPRDFPSKQTCKEREC